jgi:hypothetical protein
MGQRLKELLTEAYLLSASIDKIIYECPADSLSTVVKYTRAIDSIVKVRLMLVSLFKDKGGILNETISEALILLSAKVDRARIIRKMVHKQWGQK